MLDVRDGQTGIMRINGPIHSNQTCELTKCLYGSVQIRDAGRRSIWEEFVQFTERSSSEAFQRAHHHGCERMGAIVPQWACHINR